MVITIDLHSETPIYRQLKSAIIGGIASGELKEGDRLPSVRQLGCDLGVNLNTVNKAYTQLREEGYIRLHRSRGAVVAAPPPAEPGALASFSDRLAPIVAEMRARRLTRTQLDALLDTLWNESPTGGQQDE